MNIQIYGKAKCFDTKKAERYFKERKIQYQMIDTSKYGISPREYKNIKAAVGSINALIDEKSKEYASIKYLAYEADMDEKLIQNPNLFKTPIVRNGRQATVGYSPEEWKEWE